MAKRRQKAVKSIAGSVWFKQALVLWGTYFIFGKQPNWANKEDVRAFLLRNQYIVVWLVQLLGLNVAANFGLLYTSIISNSLLFDLFYDEASKIWSNPELLIPNNDLNPINIDKDKSFRERMQQGIQQRIQKRKERRGVGATEIIESAAAENPESVIAVITVISTFINLAAIIIKIRRYRRGQAVV